MPFEFRIFEKHQQSNQKYREIDLYFFKSKSTSVGVKARFGHEQQGADHWHFTKVQLKFIVKTLDVNGVRVQKWRKMASPTDFYLYSPQHIQQHPEKFQINAERTVQLVVREQLQAACKAIITALKPHPRLEPQHFEMNSELAAWFGETNNLQDVMIVEKNRMREDDAERGGIKVRSIFNQSTEDHRYYKTVCVEHGEENMILELVHKHKLTQHQNTSYPAILDTFSHEITKP